MKLRLETISPVHIGKGEKITSYSDYIYDDGYVYYIDYNKLENYMMKKNNMDDLIDDFVDIVRNQASSNKKRKYRLKDFFKEHGLNYKDYTYNKLPANEEITEEINRALCSGIRPYIPGSSIKGLIRTAFLYKHFSKSSIDLSKILNDTKNPYIGQEVFGKYSQDIFKYIRVSDTTLFDKKDLEIIKTHRENFKKKAEIPFIVEAIKAGTIGELDISINLKKENLWVDTILKDFYEHKGWDKERIVFDVVNTFTKKILENEIQALKKANEEKYYDLINQHIMRFNEVEKLLQSGEGAILRIGFGKTFVANSIAMKFEKIEMKQIREKVFSTKSKKMHDYEPFPITRTIFYDNDGEKREMGWVRIKKY